MSDMLREAASALRRATESRVVEHLEPFVEAVDELGDDPAALQTQPAQDFLRETAPLLMPASVVLGRLIMQTERLVGQEFFDKEWYAVCQRRSAIEWIRTLYRDLVDADWSIFMDVDNLDDMIRQKGDHEGGFDPTRIPPGTPASHWWWWYPQPPPNDDRLRAS